MPAPVVVSTPAPAPSMAVEACARMVDVAAKSCHAPGAQPVVAQPNWDAMATAIAQQSNVLALWAVCLTVILFGAGLAWGKIVVIIAEKEAREEAAKVAREEARIHAKREAQHQFTKFMAEELPQLVSQFESKLEDLTLNGGVADADAIGKKAGDEDN